MYVPVELREEALKEEKTEKKQKVNLEEIEEGIVKRRIKYFKNIIQENIKEEGELRGQSPDFRENLNRNAKNISLARITQIIEKELSEQNENVWKSDNIEKELKDYQEANSLRTDRDSATKGDDYAETRMVNVMGEKQKADLEGKPQDERKHLRREAKQVALRRIRQIAQDEISQEKRDKVYVPVELREEALKEEKTEKKQKVNLEEIEEGIVKRRIEYFENIIRKNIKEEGELHGQSPDIRENLNRKAENNALARITRIIQEELLEQNENVWKSENTEKEFKDYQEANSLRTDGDSTTQRVEEEKENLKEKLMEEERLRKEKEGQLAILKENMESLQIQNLQEVETIKREIENRLNLVTEEAKILKHEKEEMEIKIDRLEILEVETIKREIENRLNLVTEEAKILKHEKEEMEIKIDRLEILAMEIDDIVKRQRRELLRREEESKRLDKELIEEGRIRKETKRLDRLVNKCRTNKSDFDYYAVPSEQYSLKELSEANVTKAKWLSIVIACGGYKLINSGKLSEENIVAAHEPLEEAEEDFLAKQGPIDPQTEGMKADRDVEAKI
ncbi:golgin subfamily A member 6-like protein 22 [Palaemon carinicauda]|uniref:golgin subfamily A member 6-like protein 22 n=1 Tax=Palaemon carinicauda TaxID=392227 RepID=UPI0035B5CBDE